MFNIIEILDDIYFDLNLILLAIKMDNITALVEPEHWQIQIIMSSSNHSASRPSSPLSTVNNSMDLDIYLSVTCDNIDFSKACSLVKTDQMAYVEAELLHQLNISIHYHETEMVRQQAKAQQVLTKHFS